MKRPRSGIQGVVCRHLTDPPSSPSSNQSSKISDPASPDASSITVISDSGDPGNRYPPRFGNPENEGVPVSPAIRQAASFFSPSAKYEWLGFAPEHVT
jgi:hypothetical protein